jgi:hypothetical protein
MVKTPRGVDDTEGKAGESGDVDSDNHMSWDDFTVVRSKRQRVHSRQDVAHNDPQASGPRRPPLAKPKTVVGSSTTCSLKAAKELFKKRIFCVSNLSASTTTEEIKSYIESCNIKVFNVFVAKTKFEDSSAFRVSIDASDTEKFVANDIWASHIIIREWVFKKPVNKPNSNDNA